MSDEGFAPFGERPRACPFVAFDDDRDRRSERPDYRHRCFASLTPEPRAYPHQERYCLAPEFTECPIFLEWARRESASSVSGRRPATASGVGGAAAAVAGAGAAAAAGGEIDDDVIAAVGRGSAASPDAEPPAFLARGGSGPRAADPADASAREPIRGRDDAEGLWGAQKPAADESAARRVGPVSAKARPNMTHPDWEQPRGFNAAYPRLRRRAVSISPTMLLVALLVVAAIAAFFIAPGFLPKGGGAATVASATPGSTASAAALTTATPAAPTPTPRPTGNTQYTIKSGDTIYGIAAAFCGVADPKKPTADDQVCIGAEQQAIIDANPALKKNPDRISLGQVIVVPAAPRGNATPVTTPISHPATSPKP